MAAEIRITIAQATSGTAISDAAKDVADLGNTAKKAGGGFSALQEVATGALRALGAAAMGAALGGLQALGGAIMDGIGDAREAAKINAQTAAVLKSTGNAAGVSAEHVQDYAAALSAAAGKSLFGDSQIQESTNLLLTFTNIKGTVLDAATAISVDMAQALGGAPSDAAIQLGKALNDPVKGVTALTRVGVTFTQEQKDMIQAMVDTGDIAGAQQVILSELNKEFGGSAEAAAKADGGWAQFNDRLGEAKETIGAAILPLLSILVAFLNDQIMPAVESAAATFSAWLADPAVQAGIQQLVTAIQTGLGVALAFITQTALPALIAAWQTIQPAIQAVLPILAAVVASFGTAGTATSSLGTVLQDVGTIWTAYRTLVEMELAAVWAIIQVVLNQIMAFWKAHGTEITAFLQATWATIVQIVQLALELLQATIIPLLAMIAGYITAHGTEIQTIITTVWNIISGIINAALILIKGIITAALQLIKGDFSGAWETIKTMSATFVQALYGVLVAGWTLIKTLFSMSFELLKTITTTALNAIALLWLTIWTQIKMTFQGILDSIVGWVLQTMQGIVNAIRGFAGAAASAAGSVGDGIVSGITSGIKNGASAIISAAKDAAMAALNAAKAALGFGSPSKAFRAVGRGAIASMALGMTDTSPLLAGAAASAASATIAGATEATAQYTNNRTVNYSPTFYTNTAAQDVDPALIGSLAGV